MFYGEGLNKSFKKKEVVHHVNLSLTTGEVVGLFGPNGAGKTTCFRMMAGLLKPDKGKIFLGKQEVTSWPLYQKARCGLRYLPQDTSIFRGLSVQENILAVLEVLEPDEAQRRVQLSGLLDELGLQERRHASALVLSGGERRRVEIARALVGNPKFLLLDEPLAGIDPKTIEELGLLIRRLARQDIGILVTDHNVKDMLRIVDRAYVMYEGAILEEGSPQKIANNPLVRSIYLGESFIL
jgi:lipopolysaccharide export system ATP-binding protein